MSTTSGSNPGIEDGSYVRPGSNDGGTGGSIGGGGSVAAPAPTPTPAPAPSTGATPVGTVAASPPVPVPVQAPVTPPTSAIAPAIVASSEQGGSSIAADRIPLQAIEAQTFTVQLGFQSCRFVIYQKSTGLYLDLAVDAVPIVSGALCLDRVWLIRDGYIGFVGDLAFVDTQGLDDPDYTGLADRFQMIWGH